MNLPTLAKDLIYLGSYSLPSECARNRRRGTQQGHPREQNHLWQWVYPKREGYWLDQHQGGTNNKDLLLLRWRPLEGPSSSIIFKAFNRSSPEPQRVPSSRYQTFINKLGSSFAILSMMGWRAKQRLGDLKDHPAGLRSNSRWSACRDGKWVENCNNTPSMEPWREFDHGFP